MLSNFFIWIQETVTSPTTTPVTQTPAAPSALESAGPLLMMVALFAIFYFIVIRPQRKEQKKRVAMLGALKKGDRVVTTAGIFGTIVNLKDDEATLEVDENVRIRFSRAVITQVVTAEEKQLANQK